MKYQLKAQTRFLQVFPMLILALSLLLIACQLDQPSISTPGPEDSGSASSSLTVPIQAQGAEQLGSLEFVLVYEPSQLEVLDVKRGALASNALIEFNAETPGRLWAGIVDANGISGEGPVAVVSFSRTGKSNGSSTLSLENVSAYNAVTLLDMPVEPSSGEVLMPDQQVTPPVVVFAQPQ